MTEPDPPTVTITTRQPIPTAVNEPPSTSEPSPVVTTSSSTTTQHSSSSSAPVQVRSVRRYSVLKVDHPMFNTTFRSPLM
ncbi:MAG: hypothetical protein ABFS03_11210 [Chloroflexota bacterium]